MSSGDTYKRTRTLLLWRFLMSASVFRRLHCPADHWYSPLSPSPTTGQRNSGCFSVFSIGLESNFSSTAERGGEGENYCTNADLERHANTEQMCKIMSGTHFRSCRNGRGSWLFRQPPALLHLQALPTVLTERTVYFQPGCSSFKHQPHEPFPR